MTERGAEPVPAGPRREDCAYAPYFCEENAVLLARRDDLSPGSRYVVFVSNPGRSVAIWGQRLAAAGAPLVWDYHVLLVVKDNLQRWIYDFDSVLTFPTGAARYLEVSFPVQNDVVDALRPRFRVVEADTFLARFASDRSHMLDGDAYRAPPPPWPPIQPEGAPPNNLGEFIDTEADFVGDCYDLAGFARWCAEDEPARQAD